MKIDIAKDDVWWLRDCVDMWVYEHQKLPCPNEHSLEVAKKFIRKLNTALKKIYGHDCMADTLLHVEKKPLLPPNPQED